VECCSTPSQASDTADETGKELVTRLYDKIHEHKNVTLFTGAEVIKKEITGLKSAMLEATEREKDPNKKLRVFVGTRLRYLTQKEDQYISVKDEYLQHYGFIRNLTADYSDWEIETIKRIVEYGRERDLFRAKDPAAVARAIFFALKGLEYPWATNMTRDETRKSVDILLDILLKGITKREVSGLKTN